MLQSRGQVTPPSERSRFGENAKLLPVFVVFATIFVLYIQYVVFHGFRLLQLDFPKQTRSEAQVARGIQEMIIFHIIFLLMLYCFARCILTHPGTIPDGIGWDLDLDVAAEDDNARVPGLIETKHTGERRQCKWCLKYKPDRCHHCRVCNMCILRMDHHCPWVYNCIGFRNHKYFFLVLLYAAIELSMIVFCMFETVLWSTRRDVPFATMVLLIAGEAFATFLLVIVTAFLCFHIWLMAKAMTTVEFCEKSLKKASYNSSIYSNGVYRNICAVLGPQPLLWLLPVSLPIGDGITWQNTNTTQAIAPPHLRSAQAATPVLTQRRRGDRSRKPSTGQFISTPGAVSRAATGSAPVATSAFPSAAPSVATTPRDSRPAAEESTQQSAEEAESTPLTEGAAPPPATREERRESF